MVYNRTIIAIFYKKGHPSPCTVQKKPLRHLYLSDQTKFADVGLNCKRHVCCNNVLYQSNLNQPIYQPTNNIPANLEEPVSLLDWIGTILIAIRPCAGIIVYIIWAFSKDTKKSKANYCKAMLLLMLVAIVLYIIVIVVFAGFFVILASYY